MDIFPKKEPEKQSKTSSLPVILRSFMGGLFVVYLVIVQCSTSTKKKDNQSFISTSDAVILSSVTQAKETTEQMFHLHGRLRGGGSRITTLNSCISNEQVLKPLPTTRGPALKKYKQQLKMSQRQKEIAIGTMLGDVSLNTQDRGKTYRLKFQGSEKHLEYGRALHKEFDEFCLSNLHFIERVNENSKTVKSWGFQTLSHKEFTSIADIFLKENTTNKKTIKPNFVQEHLTPTVLTYWFMDDGSKMDHTENQGKGIHFHTQGFEEQEVEELCKGLIERYDLNCWKGENKGKPIVVISGESYDKFVKLVEHDILPSMNYKIPSKRKLRKTKSLKI